MSRLSEFASGRSALRHAHRASALDTLRVAFIVLPSWSKGLFLRWPLTVRLAERFGLDAAAVRTMLALRRRYGEELLFLANPFKPQALVLAKDDAARVLDGAPRPFSSASRDKQIALAHFEPRFSLITRGRERAGRRAFSESVLEHRNPVHRLARQFDAAVAEEAAGLLRRGIAGQELRWELFAEAWARSVRRIVLGDVAGVDRTLTEMLARLRRNANLVWLHPRQDRLRFRFHARLADHLARGEPGSLAALVTREAAEHGRPIDQVTQWLFAFDAGAIATWRALALIATHPRAQERAIAEASGSAATAARPYLRACFLEALRLWPTTPLILRETTEQTRWGAASLAAGTELVIFLPYFHRDPERLAHADRFAPDIWIGRDPAELMPFVPFSAGPAACPGRHLVSLVASAWLAALVGEAKHALVNGPALSPDTPLPGTLDHFRLGFRMTSLRAGP